MKKTLTLIFALCIVLSLTACGNKDQEQAASTNGKESAYFSEARINRQQARDSAMSLLQQAAKDDKASQETIEEANQAIQTMANYTLTEAQIESLVVANGFTDCVAFLTDNGINVVVSGTAKDLTDTDVAKIGEIVMEQTGLKTDQIKLSLQNKNLHTNKKPEE